MFAQILETRMMEVVFLRLQKGLDWRMVLCMYG